MLLRLFTLTCDKTDFAKIIPSAENTHSAHSSSYTCSFTVVLLHISTAEKSHTYLLYALLIKSSRVDDRFNDINIYISVWREFHVYIIA